nr:hypothetical protein [uncultured Cupriavidus sp.]
MWRTPKVRKDNVDAFSIAQALRLPRFANAAGRKGGPAAGGKAARIIGGKLHPDEVKLFGFRENQTIYEACCNREKAGSVAKMWFHNSCA